MTKPKFNLRDEVKYTLKALVDGIIIAEEKTFYVVGIKLTSDASGQIFTYSIAISMPDAYYGGKGFVHNVPEGELS